MNRRQFLTVSSATLGALGVPVALTARSASSAERRRFVFVLAHGGWDPTCVLADTSDHPQIDRDSRSQRARVRDLTWVSHPDRPVVDQFMSNHADDIVVFNGIWVHPDGHELSTATLLTGSPTGTEPDWGAAIGATQRSLFRVPHLVVDGPSFPGSDHALVRRLGVDGLIRTAQTAVKGMVPERAPSLEDQVDLAVKALSLGVARCVTIAYRGMEISSYGWDTHAHNNAIQSQLWERLFVGLTRLRHGLEAAPGPSGGTLADETVVVVMSEMGRAPGQNALGGKDHWPWTSAMWVGKGIHGGRVLGGFDGDLRGLPPRRADPRRSAVLTAPSLGAALMSIASSHARADLPNASHDT